VCALLTEYVMLGTVASRGIQGAVLVIVAGTVLAGYETISQNFEGYLFVMGNNILTAVLYTEVRATRVVLECQMVEVSSVLYECARVVRVCVFSVSAGRTRVRIIVDMTDCVLDCVTVVMTSTVDVRCSRDCGEHPGTV
jgi:hypothetical protein